MKKILQKANSSIATVFILTLLVLYLINIVISMLTFNKTTESVSKRYINQFVISQNDLEINKLRAFLEKEIILSKKLADDPQIKNWIKNENNLVLTNIATDQLKGYHKLLSSGTHFIAIKSSNNYYIDNLYQPGKTLSAENEYDSWFYKALMDKRHFTLNVNYDNLQNKVMLWINVSVKNDIDETIAIAGSGIDISDFLEKLVMDKNKGISTILVNSKGIIQAHKDRSIVDHNGRIQNESEKTTIYDLLRDNHCKNIIKTAIQQAMKDNNIQIVEITYDSKKMITAVGYLPELDWINLVLVDTDTITGLSDFLPLIFIFFISGLFIILSTLYIFKTMVFNPLNNLTSLSESIAKGNYNQQIPVKQNNEIGKLSKTFNKMSSEIYKYTQNLEKLVSNRTEQLQISNKQLSDAQKRITDSIEYAKLIQNSILPTQKDLFKYFSDFFIIYQPLDIVGGDFYYLNPVNEKEFFFAVIDCTGHGVPGSLMTMMTNALLNQILASDYDNTPDKILSRLHILVKDTLKTNNEIKYLENGLDIALCKISKQDNCLYFAGGGLSLYYTENNRTHEVKGDSLHLGFNSTKQYNFNLHKVNLNNEMSFYMLTDGILDYPGGQKGYGLGKVEFKKILNQTYNVSFDKQKDFILEELSSFNNGHIIKDDIILAGFKLNNKENNNG